MSTSVTLPALGESVTEGTVTRWLKQVGDTVEADEPLLEVSTDKVDTEIPSPVAGVLLEIKAAEDETVEVGGVLAVIGDADEAPAGDSPAVGRRVAGRSCRGAGRCGPGPDAGTRIRRRRGGRADRRPTRASPSKRPRQPPGVVVVKAPRSTLPALGESVTEGTVSRWLKQVGDIGRGRRGAAGDLHRQGRHRDPLTGGRHHPGDPGGRGRDRRGRCRAGRRRRGASQPPLPSPRRRQRPSSETARSTGGDEPEEQTAAGDEGGQAPIPAQPEQGTRAGAQSRDRGATQGGGQGRDREGRAPKRRPTLLRDPAGPQAGRRAQRRPGFGDRHRGRRSDPQAGRAGRGRGGEEGRRGSGPPPPHPRQRLARLPPRRSRPPSRATCAAPPRSCPGCARPSPSGWSSRCRSRPSSPRPSRST